MSPDEKGVESEPDSEQSPPAKSDTVSDPAMNDRQGHDWEGEGGSTPKGPATDTDSTDS